ncbi:MAG: hypothetical protein ABR513_04370 [Desulfotignum sp.]
MFYPPGEAFLDLDRLAHTDLTAYGRQIRHTVRQHTGIPVSIGIEDVWGIGRRYTEFLSMRGIHTARQAPRHIPRTGIRS